MSRLTLADLPKLPPPRYRIYSPAAVVWATVLGTAVAGGVVLGINYWRWGQKSKAFGSVIGGIALLAVVYAGAMVLPDWIPNAAYLVPQFLIAYQLTETLQGKRLAEHLAAGGQKASNWKGVGIGAIFLVIIGGGFAVWFVSSGARLATLLETQHHVSVGKDQDIYYSGGATEERARNLGAALKAQGFLPEGLPIDIVLSGTGTNTEIGFVVKPGAWDDPDTVALFRKTVEDIAPAIGGKPLTLRLLDESLAEKKRLKIE